VAGLGFKNTVKFKLITICYELQAPGKGKTETLIKMLVGISDEETDLRDEYVYDSVT
jgi:hypothetical protein